MALTARQFITGTVLGALIYSLDDPDPCEQEIDQLVAKAAYIANRQLAELARGRWEHKEKKARRENNNDRED